MNVFEIYVLKRQNLKPSSRRVNIVGIKCFGRHVLAIVLQGSYQD